MSVIEFQAREHLKDVVAEPYKASSNLPRWFRDLKPDLDLPSDKFPVGTVKRCVPVLDILSAGYIIPIPVSVSVTADSEEDLQFNWRTEPAFTAIDKHNPDQLGQLNPRGGVFKWISPWSIRTKRGYSCLFITPANRPDLPFECFSAIVDTDKYFNPVNFPFVWKQFPYNKVMQAGEPMIQVIPFKRQKWTHKISYASGKKLVELDRIGSRIQAIHHKYKREDHERKFW